ncbi:MAG: type II toxin-antitoxin system RelE/ParE family toxin [Patescibacteria group bacterium]
MGLNILFDQKAKKRFSQLPSQEKEKVARAIGLLELNKTEHINIKKLRLPKGKFFRIRVGNLRIIYEQIGKIIYISEIDFRGNVY